AGCVVALAWCLPGGILSGRPVQSNRTLPVSNSGIQSVINLRRRVKGPGLHLLVGRVPSRGVTCDVMYNFPLNRPAIEVRRARFPFDFRARGCKSLIGRPGGVEREMDDRIPSAMKQMLPVSCSLVFLIAGNLVILNRDQTRNCSLLAVNLETGRKAWETARPEARSSYGTPIVWANNGIREVVMPGSLLLKGYDLTTGEERWSVSRVAHVGCTTPVLGDGLLFFAGWAPGKADSPWPSWKDFAGKYEKNGDGNITPDELAPEMRGFHKGIDTDHDGRVTEKDFDLLNSYMAKGENV